ncbi:MAG: prepilin-type N-terminal cleavage/methylation domain-containing protein [Paucibacter sp.]|nr:prepilin-type N-terminal cleavage/methylation domain-containing protein [Roseateles sp.]
MRASRGFTLVEVLVALFVMAVMAALAWRGLDGLARSREIAQAQVDRTARLQAVLQQFEQDLLAVQDSGSTDALTFDGASLLLTRRQPGGLQAVAWTVGDGRLYRWAGPVVQQVGALSANLQAAQQFVSDDSQRVTALEGVAGWQMYFYRGNAWTNAQSTGDAVVSSPGTAASDAQSGIAAQHVALPTGVRMVLSFAPGSGFSSTLSKDVVMERPQ